MDPAQADKHGFFTFYPRKSVRASQSVQSAFYCEGRSECLPGETERLPQPYYRVYAQFVKAWGNSLNCPDKLAICPTVSGKSLVDLSITRAIAYLIPTGHKCPVYRTTPDESGLKAPFMGRRFVAR